MDPNAQAEWDKVRSDASNVHWVITKATDDIKSVVLASSGTSGFSSLLAELDKLENSLAFAAFRVRAVDDRGSLKSVRFKFIRINMVPSTVPMIKRAKAAQLKSQVDQLFTGTHASFDIASPSELAREEIVRVLQANAGAHRPNGYEFGGADAETDAMSVDFSGLKAQSTTAAAAPQAGTAPPAVVAATPVEAPAPAPATDRGAETGSPTSSTSPSSPAAPPPSLATSSDSAPSSPATVPSTAAMGASALSPVPVDGLSVEDAWRKIQSDKETVNWVMLSYDGKSPKTAAVWKMGTLGLAEYAAHLPEDRVIFGALRVTAIDDRGSVMSVRAKYVFIGYVAKGVKPIQRAQAGPAKSAFEQMLSGTHVSINVSSPDELTPADLEQRLQASAGAHRPNRYEFGATVHPSS